MPSFIAIRPQSTRYEDIALREIDDGRTDGRPEDTKHNGGIKSHWRGKMCWVLRGVGQLERGEMIADWIGGKRSKEKGVVCGLRGRYAG